MKSPLARGPAATKSAWLLLTRATERAVPSSAPGRFVSPNMAANGCAAIAKTHGISVADTLAVGNDYNDCDMLDWAGTSYVVSNAPAPLRQQYSVTASNGDAGVSVCIAKWLGGREPSTLKPTSSGE